ncbi:ABC transporter ATP-binding protein [Candidatus Dependentiae bacterium]|nr:ABC transporter ATP-binding protein [Candidatus Dependentiae bacterium]
MTTSTALNVEKLTKIFDGTPPFVAVDNLSFSVPYGQILGILGANGAGKTTLVQMLLSTLTPTSGTITMFGKNAAIHRSQVLERIGFASAYVNFSGYLTVAENLTIFGLLYGLGAKQVTDAVAQSLEDFSMTPFAHREVRSLSAGQKTRVMLAKAFLASPKLVLLDEPTASLDPDIADEVCDFIVSRQQSAGVTVIVTSHDMDEVTRMCDRVLVMQQGKIIADDSPMALAASVDTTKIHLQLSQGIAQLIQLCNEKKLPCSVTNQRVTIAIAEHDIASFLTTVSLQGIAYNYITIDKPTLHDYFLQVARTTKGA